MAKNTKSNAPVANDVRDFLEGRMNQFLQANAVAPAPAPMARAAKGKQLLAQPAPLTGLAKLFQALNPKDVSLKSLHEHLRVAMSIELTTMPVYLAAMYSMPDGDRNDPGYAQAFGENFRVQEIMRSVLVEEMLHLTLAGNVLNATGGQVMVNNGNYAPSYPCHLGSSTRDFWINLGAFSRSQIDTFLAIELPTPPGAPRASLDHYSTIGQFYNGIIDLLEVLVKTLGEKKVFSGDPKLQVGPEYYYNSGGAVVHVTDLASAKAALNLIIEQGEGTEDDIYDNPNAESVAELAHFYKFIEIYVERRYAPEQTNPRELPLGPPMPVKWDNVYPMKQNVKTADYPTNTPDGVALRDRSNQFNLGYRTLLDLIQEAFTGHQHKLIDAVQVMFRLKHAATDLMRIPFPGKPGVNAGPSFEFLDDKQVAALRKQGL